MGLLVWVMVAIALWHFTIFLPDRWWSGIVGAFAGAVLGMAVVWWAGVRSERDQAHWHA